MGEYILIEVLKTDVTRKVPTHTHDVHFKLALSPGMPTRIKILLRLNGAIVIVV